MDCCSCIWRGAVWRRSMRAEVYCTTPIQDFRCNTGREGDAYEIIKRILGVL